MKYSLKLWILLISVCCLSACNNSSQNDDTGKNDMDIQGTIKTVEEANKEKEIPKAILEFTVEAFMESMTKMELSKLALKNTSDNRIKIFAQNTLID